MADIPGGAPATSAAAVPTGPPRPSQPAARAQAPSPPVQDEVARSGAAHEESAAGLAPVAADAADAPARTRVLAMAAHELRNPLMGVGGILELLRERVAHAGTQGADVLELIDTAQVEIRRLQTMLARFVEAERAEGLAFATRREPCDLLTVVKAAARPMLQGDHPILLETSDPAPWPLVADRGRLEQVFRNILGNAAKYSPPHGLIRITLRRNGATARVTVRDQGVGIPPQEAHRIFERFYRASNVRDIGGIGIGLYLSRQIVEAHGGRIWADQRSRRGAALIVELPLARGGA